ncbi:hypothetical protein ACOYR1_14805 [Thalassotalea piscium]
MTESPLDELAISAINILQSYLSLEGFSAHVHFELEGCVSTSSQQTISIDFSAINKQIAARGIEGQLVPEYWKNQWEYVSLFAGQSPLKEAHNLTKIIDILPLLFKQQGIHEVLIHPVIWNGDQVQLLQGSKSIFQGLNKAIHIPNAIQINVSISDDNGENLVANSLLGEYIQQCFIETSYANAILFLPEQDAYERLRLKADFGLNDELCSPTDISGGHQGSIALYRQYGKHNQILGENVLIVNHLNEPLVKHINWQKEARVEHRLGASSLHYNAYINVVFALLNVIDAVSLFKDKDQQGILAIPPQPLPSSLFDNDKGKGAYTLFKEDLWFEDSLNGIEKQMLADKTCQPLNLGSKIKQAILDKYQNKKIVLANSTRTDIN